MVQKLAVLTGLILLAWLVARLVTGTRQMIQARARAERTPRDGVPVRLEQDPVTGVYRPIDR